MMKNAKNKEGVKQTIKTGRRQQGKKNEMNVVTREG